jgi:6-pyruvoyltetrahydropterin/6-carboxytetrahydropterin synthase
MYTLCVRDHIMIAHSLHGETFGPAQALHGATYVVDLELSRKELDSDGLVVDIGRLRDTLRTVLADLDYRNLDDDPALAGRNTTTEFLARLIFDRMAERIHGGELGAQAIGMAGLRVVLRESHVAWAAYEGDLTPSRAP